MDFLPPTVTSEQAVFLAEIDKLDEDDKNYIRDTIARIKRAKSA
jgi:hypothetical protein